MFLGIIADDFTGASDIANTLAKGVEAGVIALKSRPVPAAEAGARSRAALTPSVVMRVGRARLRQNLSRRIHAGERAGRVNILLSPPTKAA
ncbi:hypothetical protein KHC23_03395 [Ancylobacter dichloromethanicus]|uniref:Four-carbon acid sugar kinase N-terminal domain-containing protein n=1 Tax=Ancylobacter dichloromethanicus TaxID=518825 RepID=A0A9W6MZG1_9HYPH|nr:four-carbon acid sugar kinase family protein [Ancylobacter dichloromethanicus]MBS7552708.1 hypothetical protein [Ancylobacter dichloromethanicus]GLK72071.1 hypothetical protein GCM10017643_21870 [Ancylobacter dichloromethanicus]